MYLCGTPYEKAEMFDLNPKGDQSGRRPSFILALRRCLQDTWATFIPARVHTGSLLWLCIRLRNTKAKCHAGTSHTGAPVLVPERDFHPGTRIHSGVM